MEPQFRPDTQASLRAHLCGAPRFLRADGTPVVLPERRHQALLAYLVVHAGTPVSRDRLVDLLWPASSAESGRASLRQALSTIRRVVGEAAGLLIADRQTVMLQRDGVQHDLDAPADTRPDAVFLDGLSGFSPDFDTWRMAEQTRISEARRLWFLQAADQALDRRQTAEAAGFLAAALQIDPLDEPTHRRLMRLHLAQGRSAEALRQFDRLQSLLQSELGVRPEPATLELLREVRRGRRDAGPATPAKADAPPPTRYARSGTCNIAFQVSGRGSVDLVYVPGWVSNLDFSWTHPGLAAVYHRLGRFSRLIRFDKRGIGLSDRDVGLPTLEERMADLAAVMDAAGSRRAVLFGSSEGGNLCLLFALTHPERIAGLVLYGAYARGLWAPDYPWAKTPAELEAELAAIAREWGGPFDLGKGAPSFDTDESERQWFAAYGRASASPQDAIKTWRWGSEVDQRDLLPRVKVPTLVLHRTGDRWVKVEDGRYLAEHIPSAQLALFPGEDHLIWAGDNEPILAEMERFVLGLPKA